MMHDHDDWSWLIQAQHLLGELSKVCYIETKIEY